LHNQRAPASIGQIGYGQMQKYLTSRLLQQAKLQGSTAWIMQKFRVTYSTGTLYRSTDYNNNQGMQVQEDLIVIDQKEKHIALHFQLGPPTHGIGDYLIPSKLVK